MLVSNAETEIITDDIAGEFSIIENTEAGTFQVAYNRQPLYYFVDDQSAGDTTGQGLGGVWWVARPQILNLATSDELGTYITDATGMSLYVFTIDEDGSSNCTDDCLGAWPAFTVDNPDELVAGFGVAAQDDLSLLERADTGVLQVVYQGQPLYYFVDDSQAGDITGQGVGDVWFVVNPTVVSAAENGTLTGRDGTTLYTFASDEANISNCSGICAAFWPPLLATAPDLGNISDDLAMSISLIERDDGTQQVAVEGQPLYYFIGDGVPGDTNGDGAGGTWALAVASTSSDGMAEACTATPSSNVNLRGGPSTLYGLRGTLLTTDMPVIIGQAIGTDGFIWYLLETDAWVRSDLVTTMGSCDGLPTVAAPPLPPTPVPAQPTAVPAQQEQPAQPTEPPPPATTEEA